MKWRQIIPCDVSRADGVECEGESEHVGLHVATEWRDGEIIGPLWWDDNGRAVAEPTTGGGSDA